MQERKLFIISGCNGAGKTTASFTILPEILDCKEFVNADEIAKGLSPFQPEKASFESGRIMIQRINDLLEQNKNFAFETTLSTRSYKNNSYAMKNEDTKKQWIIFKAIYSVSPQGDGKIRNFDVMDYGFIVEYFVHMGMGPYWEIKEGLPDLLKSPDPLPLIIPMEDD
jgi:hypothetical protein